MCFANKAMPTGSINSKCHAKAVKLVIYMFISSK